MYATYPIYYLPARYARENGVDRISLFQTGFAEEGEPCEGAER